MSVSSEGRDGKVRAGSVPVPAAPRLARAAAAPLAGGTGEQKPRVARGAGMYLGFGN